jgi:hypothetical protein
LSSLCAPGNTSRSVTHPEIAPGQARLTPEFFAGGLPEKKLQLSGISMLLILLSRGGCYNICGQYMIIWHITNSSASVSMIDSNVQCVWMNLIHSGFSMAGMSVSLIVIEDSFP